MEGKAFLLAASFAAFILLLWMAKIDNDWGRLVWPQGYIDFGRKALLVIGLFVAFIVIVLLGLGLFKMFQFLWAGLVNWLEEKGWLQS